MQLKSRASDLSKSVSQNIMYAWNKTSCQFEIINGSLEPQSCMKLSRVDQEFMTVTAASLSHETINFRPRNEEPRGLECHNDGIKS